MQASESFSNLLHELRAAARITQTEFARRVLVSKSLVSRWECGDRLPNSDDIGRIILVLREFGCSSEAIANLQRAHALLRAGDDRSTTIQHPMLASLADLLSNEKLDERRRTELNEHIELLLSHYQRLILANQLFTSRQWQSAYEAYEKLREQYEVKTEKARSFPLSMQGICAYRLGHYHRAIDCYEAALAILRDNPNDISIPEMHIRLGSVYRRLGDWAQAEEHYERAQELFKSRGDIRGVATCLRSRAGNCLFQGEAERAVELCHTAIELYKQCTDPEGGYATLQHLGWALALSGDTLSAIEYQEKAQKLAEELGAIDVQIVKAKRYCADSYLAHADVLDDLTRKPFLQVAERLYTDGLQIINKLPGSEQEKGRLLRGELLFGLGCVASRRREWTKAKDYLERSEQIHRETGEQLRLGMVLHEQGRLYLVMENARLAEERLLEAERIFVRLMNNYHRANVIADLARVRMRLFDKADQVLEDVERGLAILGKNNYPKPKAWLYAAAARMYVSTGELGKAADSFAEAISSAHAHSALLVERILDEYERTVTELANDGDVASSRQLGALLVSALLSLHFPLAQYRRLVLQDIN